MNAKYVITLYVAAALCLPASSQARVQVASSPVSHTKKVFRGNASAAKPSSIMSRLMLQSSCTKAGWQRTHSAPAGKLWTMYMTLKFCHNGQVITKILDWQYWGKSRLGWPGSWVYTVHIGDLKSSAGTTGVRYTQVMAQMKFETCMIAKPVCAPEKQPWIRFYLNADGGVVCADDTGKRSTNCRGRSYDQ